MAGILLGFAGCAALILFSKGEEASTDAYYAMLIVVATFLYGLSNNIISKFLQGCNPILMTGVAMALKIGRAHV